MRDWVSNDSGDGIERDVVDAKTPDKVVDMANVLLMEFGCNDSLEEPLPIMNLADVPNFLKGSNGLAHDCNFFWAVFLRIFLQGYLYAATQHLLTRSNFLF